MAQEEVPEWALKLLYNARSLSDRLNGIEDLIGELKLEDAKYEPQWARTIKENDKNISAALENLMVLVHKWMEMRRLAGGAGAQPALVLSERPQATK